MAVYTTIDDPTLFFRVKAYSGTGSAASITFDITDTSMEPNMVWIKNRSTTGNHGIWDSVRGATKQIYPNVNYSESTAANSMTAFNSNGFSVGSDGDQNGSGNSLVAWCWKESADAGFDIVSYTGNGSNRTISHSLSAVPEMIIHKNRSAAGNWRVYHKGIGNTHVMNLDDNTAKYDDATMFQDTSPTSSVWSLGTDTALNNNTNSFIAYLFTSKQGFSKFGSYKGNASTDGTMVWTGFRPAYVIQKVTDTTSDWNVYDNKRNTFNPHDKLFYADTSAAEVTHTSMDFLSNGFKLKSTDGALNGSGNNYIFMAFAEAPFVNSKGVPCNAR